MLKFIKSRPYEGELGFGKTVTTSGRLMHSDGTFNVVRESNSNWHNVYFQLMIMNWGRFFLLMLISFGILNTIFALLYCVAGVENLNGIEPGTWKDNFTNAFFFSSQTLTTVGYGHISPHTFTTSLIASFESFTGLLIFALISGLLYGRFSRPDAKIIFSEKMIIAPHRGGHGLMFRMGNARKSELIETDVQVLATMNQRNGNGVIEREYFPLALEYSKISFFSLSWTVVHYIDDQSPIWGLTQLELAEANAEFLVLVKGIDEANQQMVHTRHSYINSEMAWNAKFNPIIMKNDAGIPVVKLQHIGDYSTGIN